MAPRAYLDAVAGAFGDGGVHYAMLVKLYGEDGTSGPERKYSPPGCLGTRKERIPGDPDKAHVSASHVERHNVNMRYVHAALHAVNNARRDPQ
jgi:hypothetical protein